MSHPPDLLVDGYISHCFSPNRDAESYLCYLLKTTQSGLKQSCLALPDPGGQGGRFAARAVPGTFGPKPLMQDPSGYLLWLLDYNVIRIGTVVPQSLWSPRNMTDLRQYVAEAQLQLPIFFTQENGALGLSVTDAANGRCQTLRDARIQAHLGGKYTTYIRVLWPGYDDFKRQIQIRDETSSKNPIKIAKFAQHIGRSVMTFLQAPTPAATRKAGDDRWIIGQNGIEPANIRVIGAIHVSAGSWMPILQLSNVWVY